MALSKRSFGSKPQDSNALALFTTPFNGADVIKIIEAGVDIPTLITLILKDGPIAFEIVLGLITLLTSGTATVQQVEAWALANYRAAYSIAVDVAQLFGISLPPLPISPGPAKP